MTKPQAAHAQDYKTYARDQKIGLMWLVSPVAILVFTLVAYAIIRFIAGAMSAESATAFKLINVLLSLLGLVGVIGIPIGLIIGMIYLLRSKLPPGVTADSRSGHGAESEVPPEILGWNWGAAGLSWVWGVGNGVLLSLLIFVPGFPIFWWIVMGLKGSEWAWRNRKWQSVEHFQYAQRRWKPWGIAFLLLAISPLVIGFLVGIVTSFSG